MNIINVLQDSHQPVEIAQELYVAKFGQIDTTGLDYGIIPADTELVDISSYIINQQLCYTDM